MPTALLGETGDVVGCTDLLLGLLWEVAGGSIIVGEAFGLASLTVNLMWVEERLGVEAHLVCWR